MYKGDEHAQQGSDERAASALVLGAAAKGGEAIAPRGAARRTLAIAATAPAPPIATTTAAAATPTAATTAAARPTTAASPRHRSRRRAKPVSQQPDREVDILESREGEGKALKEPLRKTGRLLSWRKHRRTSVAATACSVTHTSHPPATPRRLSAVASGLPTYPATLTASHPRRLCPRRLCPRGPCAGVA